jgi:hypothetical protein
MISMSKAKTIEELNKEYRRACKQEMMNDLIKEFNLLLVNDNISDKKKSCIFQIIMNVIRIPEISQ